MIKTKKKLLFIFLIILNVMHYLPAIGEESYLTFIPPMGQNNNIKMTDHESFPVYDFDVKYDPDKTIGEAYHNTNIIGHVGLIIDGMSSEQLTKELGENGSFTIDIKAYQNTNDAYVFRSEKNPMYQRPFKITLATTVTNRAYEYGWYDPDPDNLWNPLEQGNIDSSTQIRLESKHLTGIQEDGGSSRIWENIKSPYDFNDSQYWENNKDVSGIFADIILSLPGPDQSDTNGYDDNRLIVGGQTYYLAEADDYSTVIDITLTLQGTNGFKIERSISIPLSGFFSLETGGGSKDSCAVSILRLPQASNLSINNDYGRWVDIAEINLLRNIGATDVQPYSPDRNDPTAADPKLPDPCTDEDTKIAFFASSSKNPYDTSAKKFSLVRTNVNVEEGDTLDERNSVGYEIRIQDEELNNWIFDGTTHLESSSMPVSSMDGSGVPGTAVGLNCYYMRYTNHYYSYAHFHQFIGKMQIRIAKHSEMMYAGAYTSTVYLHIITKEGT